MRILTTFLLLAGALFAQSIDSVKPDCGAEGDLVLIRGSGFATEPGVDFNGTTADVLKSNDTAILVRVPEGATTGKVNVDGAASTDDFTVLPDGSPVVQHMSSKTATPGQRIVLIGRRLGGATVEFVDGDSSVAATVETKGRRRAIIFQVPEDLAAGTYTLNIINKDELDSGDCSPELEVVEAGEATLDSADPTDALPGRHIKLLGSNLSPGGPVVVKWLNGEDVLKSFGFSNGFGTVFTHVPFKAESGVTYDVKVCLRDDSETNTIEYTVGSAGAPVIDEIDPAAGPAGSFIHIKGSNLVIFGSKPKVEMKKGDTTIEATVFGGQPGFKGYPDVLIARVPNDAADGEYDVTVTVGDQTSNAKTFEVGEQPMSVDQLAPSKGKTDRRFNPAVNIKGAGFGTFGSGKIGIVWIDSDSKEAAGILIFRKDNHLRVFPPFGLAAGDYEVYVRRGTDEVLAGTYTLE